MTSRKDELPTGERLKIAEIFYSLQGEAISVGMPTVFVRLTGCPLRCQYCDTAYAFHGGQWMDFGAILEQVGHYTPTHVCVTGGEPLAQKNCLPLLRHLCDAGYMVSIETSGACDISPLDTRVVRVMDIKTPGSGEAHRNLLENIAHLRQSDQVKFVICDRQDYQWSCDFVASHDLHSRTQILFSPSYEQLKPQELAGWILADRLNVRFQLQLHKILWGDGPGH